MRKSLIVVLCFLMMLLLIGIAVASTGQSFEKVIIAPATDKGAESAMASMQFNLTEALTPKAGVVFQVRAIETFGQQEAATLAVAPARETAMSGLTLFGIIVLSAALAAVGKGFAAKGVLTSTDIAISAQIKRFAPVPAEA